MDSGFAPVAGHDCGNEEGCGSSGGAEDDKNLEVVWWFPHNGDGDDAGEDHGGPCSESKFIAGGVGAEESLVDIADGAGGEYDEIGADGGHNGAEGCGEDESGDDGSAWPIGGGQECESGDDLVGIFEVRKQCSSADTDDNEWEIDAEVIEAEDVDGFADDVGVLAGHESDESGGCADAAPDPDDEHGEGERQRQELVSVISGVAGSVYESGAGIFEGVECGLFESAGGIQRGEEQHEYSGEHQQTLEEVGPDGGEEATEECVGDDGDGEDEEAHVVAEGVDDSGIFGGGEFGSGGPCELEDNSAGFELSEHKEGQVEEDKEGAGDSESGAVEAAAEKIRDGDGAGSAAELCESLAEDPEAGDGYDHVAADPEGDDPSVGVDVGGEAHEGTAALDGGGECESPDAESAVTEEEALHEAGAAGGAVGERTDPH